MNRRVVVYILCAILLAWTAAVFFPARHFAFVNWDDFNEVIGNPHLHPPTVQHLREIWSGPYLRMYAPLSYSAWWLLSQISGATDNPVAFHLLNIGLHLVCVALVFSILIFCVKSPMAAFGGAAIFALHPLQAESVGWVSEMNNLLAAALALGAIRLYLAFRIRTNQSRWWFYAAGFVLFVLALSAKPTAVVAPVIALILDLGFVRGKPRQALAAILPWLAAAGVFAWVAHASQPGPAVAIWNRPLVAMDALAFYCGKIFWPAGMTIDYGRTPERILSSHIWLSNLGVIALLLVILFLVWQSQRGVVMGAMIMIAGLLPVLGFVPFAFQEYLLAAAGKWALPIGGALAILLAILSVKQLEIWTDSRSLVVRTLSIDPGSAIGNSIIAEDLVRQGDVFVRENDAAKAVPYFNQAIPYFQAAIERDPTSTDFHFNLGNDYLRLQEYEKAIVEYQKVTAAYEPNMWMAIENMSAAYIKLGKTDEAKKELQRGLEIFPNNPQLLQNLQLLQSGVPLH
jgi:hypothetical protein